MTLKLSTSKDGIIKTVLRIDPTSVANFGYDVVTGAMKAIQSAGKLGSAIRRSGRLVRRRKENKMAKQLLPNGSICRNLKRCDKEANDNWH